MTKSIERLCMAKEILEPPSAWCQGALAKDKHGQSLFSPASKEACSWCMVGAMDLAAHRLGIDVGNSYNSSPEWDALRDVIKPGCKDITIWQDHLNRKKGQVLRAFDDAIKLLIHREDQMLAEMSAE